MIPGEELKMYETGKWKLYPNIFILGEKYVSSIHYKKIYLMQVKAWLVIGNFK